MMEKNDSISRAALLAAYDAAHKGPPGGARKLIEEAPGLDVAPVVHGYIDIRGNAMDGEDCYCSECDAWGLLPSYVFCPYCGAIFDADTPACGPDYCEIEFQEGGEPDA